MINIKREVRNIMEKILLKDVNGKLKNQSGQIEPQNNGKFKASIKNNDGANSAVVPSFKEREFFHIQSARRAILKHLDKCI